jgi:hypothetical protein
MYLHLSVGIRNRVSNKNFIVLILEFVIKIQRKVGPDLLRIQRVDLLVIRADLVGHVLYF